MGRRCFSTIFGLWGIVVQVSMALAGLELSHVSTLYLPKSTTANDLQFDAEAVEQISYHIKDRMLYTAGERVLHVVDTRDVTSMTLLYSMAPPSQYVFTDVSVCGDYVFVTLGHDQNRTDGRFTVYKKYDSAIRRMVQVQNVDVAIHPEKLFPLSNCKTVIMLDEAKRYQTPTQQWQDPKGTVNILEFPNGVENSRYTSTSLDFGQFDSSISSYLPQGVRHGYSINNTPFSASADPEFATVDESRMTAYVSLQDNNAIAVVDLSSKTITKLYGLGYKQWGYFDASDVDGGIGMTLWPIRAWYQPDGIEFVTYRGKRYLFIANEGGHKEYDDGFNEAMDGTDFNQTDLGSSIPDWVKTALSDPKRLGALHLSKYEGKVNNKYEALYAFGGRSWSIRNADTMELIYDSGSHIEESIALHCPHLFNRDPTKTSIDSTSNEQGPGVEVVMTAEISGRLYVFVASEDPGSILVYSIGEDSSHPRFEQIFCDGFPKDSRTPEQLYAAGQLYAVDPEDFRYIPASETSAPYPILMVAGAVSGTVSVLRVNVTAEPHGGSGGSTGVYTADVFLTTLTVLLGLVTMRLHQ